MTARADRIDIIGDGLVRIYDFKTSANAAKTSARRDAPQLALEGLLASEGAFAGIAPGSAVELAYIVATGGEPPGEYVAGEGHRRRRSKARIGPHPRIARFDDPATPYAYETRAIFRDKAENDPYAHLGRVDEWSAGAGEDEDGDDESASRGKRFAKPPNGNSVSPPILRFRPGCGQTPGPARPMFSCSGFCVSSVRGRSRARSFA